MKKLAIGLMLLALVCLAGCSKGTKVHIEDERTIEETRPTVTGDSSSGSTSTLRVGKDGKIHYEEETTTESTRPVVTGD